MIRFYRRRDCPLCADIQEAMERMVLAHEVIMVEKGRKEQAGLPAHVPLPVLMDEGKLIQGAENIKEHLERLEGFKAEWERFQTDACYCDENGEPE
jgi:glutaredoxin